MLHSRHRSYRYQSATPGTGTETPATCNRRNTQPFDKKDYLVAVNEFREVLDLLMPILID